MTDKTLYELRDSSFCFDTINLEWAIVYMEACETKNQNCISGFQLKLCNWGAQWLSGRVLELRPKDRGFGPHRHHCVVVLGQDTFIYTSLVLVQSTKTRPCLTERLLMGPKESNQTNKQNCVTEE